jgi:Ca2+-binding RTX toxin-like protein
MAIINGDGGNNALTGTTTDDEINGLAGDDLLFGLTGNDTLDGGLGADIMFGGLGNDIYIVDDNGDIVGGDNGGFDTVRSSVGFILQTGFEHLELQGATNINGTGNAALNSITGNTGDNVLTGLGGNDVLIGLDGNDTLIGGIGKDTLTGGAGQDTFHFSGAITNANADIITAGDFINASVGLGGDILDLSDILVGFGGPVENFVQVTQVGPDTIVKVDVNGLAGGTTWVNLVTIKGVNLGTDEAALVASGNLVVT